MPCFVLVAVPFAEVANGAERCAKVPPGRVEAMPLSGGAEDSATVSGGVPVQSV